MGAKESKAITRTENNTLVMNKASYDASVSYITEQTTEIVNNFLVSNATASSATNKVDISGATIIDNTGAGITIDINQENMVVLNFTSEVRQNLQQDLSKKLTSAIDNKIVESMSSDILTELVSNATANMTSGYFNITQQPGSSDTSTINNTTISNESATTIDTVVKNVVANNYKSEQISQCLSSVGLSNIGDITDSTIIAQGDSAETSTGVKIAFNQSNKSNQVISCMTNQQIVSNVVDELANAFGVSVDKTTTMTNETKEETTSDTTVESRDIGNVGSDVITSATTGVGGIISSAWSGITGFLSGGGMYVSISIAICVCCVLIITVAGIAFILTSEQGGKNIAQIADVATDIIPQTAALKGVGKMGNVAAML